MNTKSISHQDRVFQTAKNLIFTKGINGWSMNSLAADSGITKRTLYKIINNKEDLVLQIVIGYITEIQEKLNNIILSGIDYFTIMEKLMSEFPLLVKEITSNKMTDIFLEYPEIEKTVIMKRGELTKSIITFLEKGIEEGYLNNDLKPEFILQMLQGSIIYFIRLNDEHNDFSKNIKDAFNVLINGFKNQEMETRK